MPQGLRVIRLPLIAPLFLGTEFAAPPTVAGLEPRCRTLLGDGRAAVTLPGGRTERVLLSFSFRIDPSFEAAADWIEPG
jgi:hypothetical protein